MPPLEQSAPASLRPGLGPPYPRWTESVCFKFERSRPQPPGKKKPGIRLMRAIALGPAARYERHGMACLLSIFLSFSLLHRLALSDKGLRGLVAGSQTRETA